MANESQESTEIRTFQNEKIEVIYRKLRPPEESDGKYPPITPGVTIEDGISYERDVPVTLRRGLTIYTDIYRPVGATNVPAIIAWSPSGKRASYVAGMAGMSLGTIPGVPKGTVSPMAKNEAPDPAYWCHHGYAVINPDAPGSGYSEGDINVFGTVDGRDCCDVIEWVADREWCNGRVGMAGNSWLAIVQYFAAAEQPPNLTCIAPWEGLSDFYRDVLCKGGVPEVLFWDWVESRRFGPGRVEDVIAMIHKYPLMNAYWEDKIPRFENIKIPTYITGGWSHFHLLGSLRAFRLIPSESKWLRVHRDFEWPDFYSPPGLEDLRCFFDRYLKCIRNGWEFTPPVRLDVMDTGDTDYQINRPEKEWPLARTVYEKLYLDADTGQLFPHPLMQESSTRYDANRGRATFTIKFDQETELTGYMKLRLWVEADGSNDMDIFVTVQKLSEKGEFLPTFVLGQPHPGVPGLLRVSHREMDEDRSTPPEPFLTNRREQLLNPNEIVPVEIGIWPSSKIWHAGEQLRIIVSGQYIRAPGWFEPFGWETRNQGEHIVHTGRKFDSHLLIPKIPR